MMDRVRLYRTLRSAHLERAHELTPATIVFESRRYDFDEALADGLDLVQAGRLKAAFLIARSGASTIEINEPLMLAGLFRTSVSLVALSCSTIRRRSRPTVVTYAIENRDPFPDLSARGRLSRPKSVAYKLLSRYVWSRIDRVAFGTEASKDLYRRLHFAPLPRREEILIPALPSAAPSGGAAQRDGAVFLGAFSARKGFPLVAAAWPLVARSLPEARLTVLGKGSLENVANDLAVAESTVEVLVDPVRGQIHRELARALVVILPSQPAESWREQVGLPIVEGLSHGCSIVTTTETGLASWLTNHGHFVIDPGTTAEDLAVVIVRALEARRSALDVTADLPAQDGRLAADDWLFARSRR